MSIFTSAQVHLNFIGVANCQDRCKGAKTANDYGLSGPSHNKTQPEAHRGFSFAAPLDCVYYGLPHFPIRHLFSPLRLAPHQFIHNLSCGSYLLNPLTNEAFIDQRHWRQKLSPLKYSLSLE